LTTFKVSTQSHSRTQNSKWLTELYHVNPAWIHPRTAAAHGIGDGDLIVIESATGTIETRASLTEGVHPRTVAISNHCGGDTACTHREDLATVTPASPIAGSNGVKAAACTPITLFRTGAIRSPGACA